MLILAKIKSLISILEKQPNLKLCLLPNAFAKNMDIRLLKSKDAISKTCILSKIIPTSGHCKTIEGCLVMLKK
jgi:hypothetical protein